MCWFTCPAAHGILVLQLGIRPLSPAPEGGSVTTGPPDHQGSTPTVCFLRHQDQNYPQYFRCPVTPQFRV